MLRFILFLFSCCLICGAAAAQVGASQRSAGRAEAVTPGAVPLRAPAPDWVDPLPIPDVDPARRERPTQTLLVSNQSLYGAERHEHFTRIATLVQTAQGLQAVGNVVLPWQPDQSELIVHAVRIVRAGVATDVLERGQSFTVLRREGGLETATLDGVLTAAMLVEGLTIGDVLDLSYTIRERRGALPLRGENWVTVAPETSVRRLHVRQIWSSAHPQRWRGTGLFANPTLRQTRLGSELVADLRDVSGTTPPAMAPARFSRPDLLEISAIPAWRDISRDVAPHYERAITLAPGSALRAEIARIAAAHVDSRQRAMAALRLVQDQVRYVALVMGDGNYLPASAEQTWTRRYGDCKGKSVLLVALLRGLGIEAEPMLVNAGQADGMDGRLPQFRQFNHVIVRARIDGRSYWLDGAASGDRSLDDLAGSALQWGLPVRPEGAELEAIPWTPPVRPLIETRMTYDASNGLLSDTRTSGETVFRGAVADAMRNAYTQQGEQAFAQAERAFAAQTGSSDVSITHAYDDATGEFAIRFTGIRRMNWSGPARGRRVMFRFDNSMLDWRPPMPEDKDGRTAPILLNAPPSIAATETIILPFNGEGFTVTGENIDRTIAGARLRRTVSMTEGRAVSRSEFQLLQLELPLAELAESEEARGEIAQTFAQVSGSANRLTPSDRRVLRGGE